MNDKMTTTPDQIHILQHSLGLDKHGQSRHFTPGEGRNHYCHPVEDTTSTCAVNLAALVTGGLFVKTHCINQGRDAIYAVTPAGIHHVALNSELF